MVGGVKPTCLKAHGHDIYEPALDHEDFGAALRTAQAAFDQHQPEVVVGSSRGGAVAMNLKSGSARPALPGVEEMVAGPDGEAPDADPPLPS